ncbi:hypothetical protein TYRP_011776 [Tyrophagus putrescentiae]|nr:hypothetical protein TYRP_011776 [Tyrophagus putrescentiae]
MEASKELLKYSLSSTYRKEQHLITESTYSVPSSGPDCRGRFACTRRRGTPVGGTSQGTEGSLVRRHSRGVFRATFTQSVLRMQNFSSSRITEQLLPSPFTSSSVSKTRSGVEGVEEDMI